MGDMATELKMVTYRRLTLLTWQSVKFALFGVKASTRI